MSDLSKMIGTELTSFSYAVERGKIRETALAIGDENPLYTDPEYARARGYRDVIAPPTFGICIDFWGGQDFMALCRKLHLNPVKVLHGEQEYQYFGEIYPGDTLNACCLLKNYIEKPQMSIFILETTYSNQKGEKVLVSRSTVIEKK